MKALIIGGGGREHALACALSKSPLIHKLYATPGNSGIQTIAQIANIQVQQVDEILSFVKKEQIDLTVVGPELPLTLGVVDNFRREGWPIMGPTALASEIEGSKVFSKNFMVRNKIPTAIGKTCHSLQEAKDFIRHLSPPYVVKADGLAAGKGVLIPQTEEKAFQVIDAMLEGGSFGEAGKSCVVEEFIQGEEVSYMVLTDGETICPLVPAQDYKRIFNADQGPNTGGMGAFAPSPLITREMEERILKEVMSPAIRGMAKEGRPYQGILYAGLMISPSQKNGKKEKIYVLEFNARLGDPETQAVLPLIKEDIVEAFMEVAHGKLKKNKLSWENKKAITVVMSSKGYPGPYESGMEIHGLPHFDGKEDLFLFHAGTYSQDSRWFTQGGRVLAVTSLGKTFQTAHSKVYEALEKISFEGGHYRTDIGKKLFQS